MTDRPATLATDEDRLVEPPDPSIWQDVVGRCPTCGTVIKGRLAIEQQARQAALDDVRREVEGLPVERHDHGGLGDDPEVILDDVLTILDRLSGEKVG